MGVRGVLCGCGRRAHHNVPEESVGTLLSHQLQLTRELLEEGERLRPAVEGLGGASEGALQLTRALVQRNHHALLVLERARRVRRARGGSRHPSCKKIRLIIEVRNRVKQDLVTASRASAASTGAWSVPTRSARASVASRKRHHREWTSFRASSPSVSSARPQMQRVAAGYARRC